MLRAKTTLPSEEMYLHLHAVEQEVLRLEGCEFRKSHFLQSYKAPVGRLSCTLGIVTLACTTLLLDGGLIQLLHGKTVTAGLSYTQLYHSNIYI